MGYTGTVRHRSSGAPLAGIPVTDGKNITKTDENGTFSLPGWERSRLIYANVLTDRHDDWYQPIEEGRNCYDFSLEPVKIQGAHSFLHLSDTEIFDMTDEQCAPWLDFVRERGQGAAFLMHGGDICGDNGLPRHCRLMNAETMGVPVRYCIGNHDYRGREFGESVYEQYYGPTWYSFDCGNVHYVVTAIRNGDFPSGYEPEDQWDWLLEDLKQKDPAKGLVLFNHGCCMGRFSRDYDRRNEFCIDRDDREALLKASGLLAVVFGHLHLHHHSLCDGFHFICTGNPKMGGIDASPAGMRRVQINEGLELSSRLLYCDDRTYQMPENALWSVQLSGEVTHCAPVVSEDTLLVGTVQDGWPKNCGIHCLDGQGRQLWFYPTANSVKNDLTVENGRVFAQDAGGRVYALDARTGTALWTADVPLGSSRFEALTGVTAYRGRLFAGSCRQISALDPDTGRILWTSQDMLYGENTPCRPVFWQDLVILCSNWENIRTVNVSTGKDEWHIADRRCRFFYATPLVCGDMLVIPSKRCVSVMRLADAKLQQVRELTEYCVDSSCQPVLDGDVLYVSTVTDGVLALDAVTLAQRCHYPAGKCLTYSSGYSMLDDASVDGQVLVKGGYLCFAGSDGYLYTYEKRTGALADRQKIGAPALVGPVFFGGGIAAADLRGRISVFPTDL